jgi:hypothetical protein
MKTKKMEILSFFLKRSMKFRYVAELALSREKGCSSGIWKKAGHSLLS